MNALAWVRANLALPLAMVALTAGIAGVIQTTEIDGREYATLSRTYFEGSDRYRGSLEAAAQGGTISKWAYAGLLSDFWADAHGLALPPGNDQPMGASRADLMAQIKHKARRP